MNRSFHHYSPELKHRLVEELESGLPRRTTRVTGLSAFRVSAEMKLHKSAD